MGIEQREINEVNLGVKLERYKSKAFTSWLQRRMRRGGA